MEKKTQVCVLAAAGMLGSSFDEEGFRRALPVGKNIITV